MAINPNIKIPTPQVRPQTPPADTAPQTQAPAKKEEPDFLSGFKADKALAKPDNKSFQNFGDEGKRAQAIAFNSGMYPSRDVSSPQALQKSFDQEVDGKVGPRTQKAFSDMQSLMKKAGLYNGPINGQFNSQMAQGLDKLRKTEQLPTNGLSAQEQQQLGRLASAASQKAVQPTPPAKGEDTFTKGSTQAPNGAPNINGEPKKADGAKVTENLDRLLGNKLDPAGSMASGPERTEALAQEAMQMAATDPKLTKEQNDAALMQRFKALGTPEQLGMDPAHNTPDNLRAFLNGHAAELGQQAMAQNAQAIQKLTQTMGSAVSPVVTSPAKQKEMMENKLASLANNPDQVRQITGLPNISNERAKKYVDLLKQRLDQVTSAVPNTPQLNLPAIQQPPPVKQVPAGPAAPKISVPTGSPWTLGAD